MTTPDPRRRAGSHAAPSFPPAAATSPAPTPSSSHSTLSASDLDRADDLLSKVASVYSERVVGQQRLRVALLSSLIAGGHVLLESVPGLAKTTAAQALAAAVSGSFRRIQCTPDLMPNDIIGTQVLNVSTGEMSTQLGPVHANIVLLDEINRSSAKTQSAMLEAMQERQTSIGGVVYPLPTPFMVLATQNPIEEEGTYVLPEAQMDRFLMKEVLTYPSPADEADILERVASGAFERRITHPPISIRDVMWLQEAVNAVYVAPVIRQYIVALVGTTRGSGPRPVAGIERHVRVGAEEHVDLAGGRDRVGVVGLGLDRVAGVLLTDLGVQDDDVGASVPGRPGLGGRPLHAVDLHRPAGLVHQAVEAVGGGQLGDGHRAPLALQPVELVGGGRLGLRAVSPGEPHAVGHQRVRGGHHPGQALVVGVVGRRRAAVPAAALKGLDHWRQGPEHGVAAGHPVRGDRDLHAAQGQVHPGDPGLLAGDHAANVPLPAGGVVHDRHMGQDVTGVADGQVDVGRGSLAGRGVGGRFGGG